MPQYFKSKAGKHLETFLFENADDLRSQRYLYVLSMNLDNHHIKNNKQKKIFKFGIGGMNYRNDDQNPYPSRLRGYVINYGLNNKDNHCQGVKIHYLFSVQYNKNIEPKKSKIHNMEKKIKQKTEQFRIRYKFKEADEEKTLRGTERIETTFDNLMKIIRSTLNTQEREAENRYRKVIRKENDKKIFPMEFRRKSKGKFIYLMSNNYEKSFKKDPYEGVWDN